MINEKEARRIGLKVIQRVSHVKRKRWFKTAIEKIYLGYDIYSWDGDEWSMIPIEEVEYACE